MLIDPRRTFRAVIEGSTNRDAIERIRHLVRARRAPTPLLLRGASDVGKTLLLNVAANELVRRSPGARVAALTGEEFCNAYITAIRSGRMPGFREYFDCCDVLVVDGMEDFETRAASFDELDRAIRVSVARAKPVILATGPAWNDQLEWLVRESPVGSAVTIGPHTLKLRVAALERRCRARRQRLSIATLTTIARTSKTIGSASAALDRFLIERDAGLSARKARKPSSRAS